MSGARPRGRGAALLGRALWAGVACLTLGGLASGCRSEEQIAHEQGYAEGRAVGEEQGYAEGRQAGFKAGHEKGLARGYSDGVATGRLEATADWAPIGFGAGALLGLGLVLIIRRRDLQAALARRRLAQRLAAYQAQAGALSAEAGARLTRLLAQVGGLEAVVPREHLAPLARSAVELVQVQDRLAAARRATPPPDPARVAELTAAAEAADGPDREAAEDALTALRRVQAAHARGEVHAQRVALKLEALTATLDHLRIGAANLDAAARPAVAERLRGEVAEAVDDLERAVATSQRELAEL